jgi:tetratricopeptide (TPR) repeat protein
VAQLTESLALAGNNDVKTLLSLSEKCYELGDYETAADCAEKAINVTKTDWASTEENRMLISRAWVIRARVKWRQNEISAALADYHKAISLDPKNAGLLSELAALQTVTQQPERALATWHSVGRLYPPDQEPPQVVFGCGDAYMAMRQYQLACEQYETANQRWPEDINSYCRLAEAKLACGKFREASSIAQRAAELAPNNRECLAIRNHVESVIAQQMNGNVR